MHIYILIYSKDFISAYKIHTFSQLYMHKCMYAYKHRLTCIIKLHTNTHVCTDMTLMHTYTRMFVSG